MAAFFRRGGKKEVAPQDTDDIDELYYGGATAPDLADDGLRLTDEALAQMLADIYNGTWDTHALLASDVLDETRRIFHNAIEEGAPAPQRAKLRQTMQLSTDVFSAFRVHRQARDIAALLIDENGHTRPFRDFAEKAQPYLNHQNRAWLRTEYDTAVRRAHDEADWQTFQEDRDIYPNLEWVQTTAANPAPDHRPFWGTVRPIDDEFWTHHRPGDRWNCQCSLRSTNKPANGTTPPQAQTAPQTRRKGDSKQSPAHKQPSAPTTPTTPTAAEYAPSPPPPTNSWQHSREANAARTATNAKESDGILGN